MLNVVERPILNYMDIKGWGTLNEMASYIAFNLPDIVFPAKHKLVEVGVGYGRSIAYLADQLRLAGREETVELYAVDLWKSNNQYRKFIENMIDAGINHMVKPIRADSRLAVNQFKDDSLDYVFLDADHKYLSTKLDILAWLPKLKTNSICSVHDIHLDSVRKAVNDTIGLKNGRVWGQSWVYRT